MGTLQFSDPLHAEIYKIYRPNIPQEIASKIVCYLKEKYKGSLVQAVDVGCGSGQSTAVLSPHFTQVTGIDESKAQIDEVVNCRKLPNTTFRVGPAEILPFADNSVQLVSACASLHWFQKKAFFEEVRRILPNNGVFVAYTYHFMKPLTEDPACTEEINKLYQKMCEELLPYFSSNVVSSLNKYSDVSFPFEEVVRAPDFRQIFDGKLTDIIGYMQTMSGFQNLKRKIPEKAEEIISDFTMKLKSILKLYDYQGNETLPLYRDFYMVLCRKCL